MLPSRKRVGGGESRPPAEGRREPSPRPSQLCACCVGVEKSPKSRKAAVEVRGQTRSHDLMLPFALRAVPLLARLSESPKATPSSKPRTRPRVGTEVIVRQISPFWF